MFLPMSWHAQLHLQYHRHPSGQTLLRHQHSGGQSRVLTARPARMLKHSAEKAHSSKAATNQIPSPTNQFITAIVLLN